jgi:hypothetical protein
VVTRDKPFDGEDDSNYEHFEAEDDVGSSPFEINNHSFWAWALLAPFAETRRVLLSNYLPGLGHQQRTLRSLRTRMRTLVVGKTSDE